MKKDITRDYSTSAFVLWAREGFPTEEEIRRRLDEAQNNLAEFGSRTTVPALRDLLAVAQAFELLCNSGRGIVCRAVRAVYMADPARTPGAGDISSRVVRFARLTPTSEAQTYRYLKQARDTFAALRGLRVEE